MPRLLLVEDNEENRDGLSRHLRRKGFEVLVAVDGQQGVEAARGGTPDLILMDMSLPVLDGWEATRRLKANPLTRNIPVIALTGHVIERSRERAIEAGADGYLTKPCFPDSLLAEVQRVMKQPRQH
jgi:two-component system cell cycle response regulator DivK